MIYVMSLYIYTMKEDTIYNFVLIYMGDINIYI